MTCVYACVRNLRKCGDGIFMESSWQFRGGNDEWSENSLVQGKGARE